MSGYVRISLLDIFFGYDFKSYPNSQKLSDHNLTYPILSYPILSYPKLSLGANSQMKSSQKIYVDILDIDLSVLSRINDLETQGLNIL